MKLSDINLEKLKRDLMDYYGTASYSGYQMAMMEVIDIEKASPDELVKLAISAGFDISSYQENEFER